MKTILAVLIAASSLTAQEANKTETEIQTIIKGLADIKSENAKTRRAAVLLLGKYSQIPAVNAVCAALTDPSPEVRQTALTTVITKVREVRRSIPTRKLYSFSKEKNISPFFYDSTTQKVLKLIGDEKVSIRRLASASIRIIVYAPILAGTKKRIAEFCDDPEIRKIILAAYSDKDSGVRQNMYNNYIFFRKHVSDEILIKGIDDKNRTIRTTAIKALYTYRSETTIKNIDKIMSCKDQKLRQAVVQSLLYQSKKPAGNKMMQKLLHDPNPIVAGKAICSLLYSKTIVDKNVIAKVLDLLADEDIKEGETIINYMRGQKHYNKMLRQFSSDLHSPYRISAIMSLASKNNGYIPVKELIKLMDTNDKQLIQACRTVLASNNFTLSDLEPLINSKHLEARRAVYDYCYKFNNTSDRSKLLKDLIIDKNISLRAKALSSYISYHCTNWKEVAETALTDKSPVVVYEVVRSLLCNGVRGRDILHKKFTVSPDFKAEVIKYATEMKNEFVIKKLMLFK